MEKRKLDKLGIETSLLGFGCMRFPMKEGKIDETEAGKMLDLAMRKGVNYYDTAYPYHEGESESFLGRALSKYKREDYFLATKLPVWQVNSAEDAERIFAEQLQKLQTEYIDFYLLHALNKERFNKMKELKIIEFCEQLQREGKIKYFGFSFHDDYEAFEEILTYRSWDFCQIQYNFVDREEQAGDRGYKLAEEMQVPLIIMEPLKGGRLTDFSEDINNMFHEMNPNESIASFGLRWVAGHPDVKVILSGMSDWEQVEDNLNTFSSYRPITQQEKEKMAEIDELLKSRVQNGCTGCSYCMPCPAGVDIPLNFKLWNNYHMFRNYNIISREWEERMEEEHKKASQCIKCGKCETKCPQKIKIREDLIRVTADLSNPKWRK